MFQLITIEVENDKATGLGAKNYKTHPRIGEWVDIEIDGVAHMYKVVMVVHSSTGDGSDLYVKKLDRSAKCVLSLCSQKQLLAVIEPDLEMGND